MRIIGRKEFIIHNDMDYFRWSDGNGKAHEWNVILTKSDYHPRVIVKGEKLFEELESVYAATIGSDCDASKSIS